MTHNRFIRVKRSYEVSVSFEVSKSNEDVEITGNVKWGGCSNLNIDVLHICSIEEFAEISKCVAAAYALTAQILKDNNVYMEYDVPVFEEYKE